MVLNLSFLTAVVYPILSPLSPLHVVQLAFSLAIGVGTSGNAISSPTFFPGQEQQGVFLLTASDEFLQGKKKKKHVLWARKWALICMFGITGLDSYLTNDILKAQIWLGFL